MKHLHTKLAAILTVGAMSGVGSAHAGDTDFSTVTDNIVQSSSNIPNLVSTVAYVGGIGMGVAGVFKIKDHVGNPGQVPLKDGLVRLGAGGGLLALPFMTEAMTNTISAGDEGNVSPDNVKFDAVKF